MWYRLAFRRAWPSSTRAISVDDTMPLLVRAEAEWLREVTPDRPQREEEHVFAPRDERPAARS